MLQHARPKIDPVIVSRVGFKSAKLLFIFLFALCLSQVSFGQASGGSISGTVLDSTGSAVPNAAVSTRNTATGIVLTTQTNGTGYYVFPVVNAGTYTVTVKASGFDPRTTTPFEVSTGQQQSIPVTVAVGTVTAEVQVDAAAQLMNTTSSDLGSEVTPEKVANLPLNERNFFPLIGLAPGVNASSSSSQGTSRGGFEVNGAPGLSNNILLDGVDATFGETQGIGAGAGSITNTLSIDAIAEFRLLTSVPSAQYGRASGGILSINTKSGGNQFHGGLFYYFRNDALDANTWAAKAAIPIVRKPELRFNDFGANIGGPVPFLNKKAFFFFNYEGDRTIVGSTTSGNTPTQALINAVTNPAIKTELQLMPAPTAAANGPQTVDGTPTGAPAYGIYTGNRNTISNENLFMGRGDIFFGQHHIIARYNYNTQLQQIEQFRVNDSLNYPVTVHNAVLSDVWTLGSSMVNELRIGLNRNIVNRNLTTYYTDPTGSFFTITGAFNSDTTQSLLATQTTTYSLVDNFSWVKGRHSFIFGTDDRYVPSRRNQNTSPRSNYQNAAALVADTPNQLAVSFGGPKRLINFDWAGYAEDSWRATPRLTLNYGVRYDYFTPFSGAYNITSNDFFAPISNNRNQAFFTEDRFNFAPRLGFIYDALGSHKLTVRGAFGLLFIPPEQIFAFGSAFSNPLLPFDATFQAGQVPAGFSIQYPISRTVVQNIQNNPSLIPAGLSFGESITQYKHPDQYSENYNLNVQYQITKDLYTQIAYVGLIDRHEVASSLPNQYLPHTCPTSACVGGIRPYPALGAVTYNVYSGITQYNGLQTSLDYRHGKMVQADMYYTYAEQYQTWNSAGSLGNGQTTLQNPNDGKSGSGPSPGFTRNRLTGVFLINGGTPGFAKGNAFGRGFLGGWSVQGITTFNSGAALNVLAPQDLVRNGYTSGTRPDRVQGVSLYDKGTYLTAQHYLRWLNPAAFDAITPYNAQRYGNLGYDALRGPSAVNLDASVIKHITIYREHHIDFRVEAFNILNHMNLSNPNTTFSTTATSGAPNATPNGAFGEITSRSAPRNLQLALRYAF